jgi:hypothetical protein
VHMPPHPIGLVDHFKFQRNSQLFPRHGSMSLSMPLSSPMPSGR